MVLPSFHTGDVRGATDSRRSLFGTFLDEQERVCDWWAAALTWRTSSNLERRPSDRICSKARRSNAEKARRS